MELPSPTIAHCTRAHIKRQRRLFSPNFYHFLPSGGLTSGDPVQKQFKKWVKLRLFYEVHFPTT